MTVASRRSQLSTRATADPPDAPGRRLAPIMSMLKCATMRSSGTGGALTKRRVPHSPCSSPLSQTKTMVRLGRGAAAICSAIESTAALPEALSSAEL